ncbi:MAG: bacteriohemerythrin, partial [Bdellovibrionaceae bacterium]|nr:bacteriohemerythrin [Pseudobdellovibrionaceae bacterium]
EKGLSAVQSAVDTTKSRVESLSRETQERSTSGYLTAKDCEKMFAGLSTFVESSNRMVEQISLATEEQSQGVRLLDKAFRDLQEIAERNRLVGQQAIAHTSEFDKEIKSLSVSVDGLFVDWSLEKSTKRFSSFVWSDDLAFGLPHMDDEHKGIFLRMNSLISALERKDTTQLKSLYDDLSSFVVEHFRHEEEFMRSVHYPQLESHQKIHKNLLERVGQFGKDIEQGTLDERKLVSFLRNWLISHIMGVDRQYAQHAKGVHSKRAA